jgi:hypothetical protein
MESTQSLVHLVAKLETLVNRFEQALGGPAVPLGSGPVASAPSSQAEKAAPAKTAAAPVKKENPIFADFDKEVASKIKPMEDAANVLGGLIPTIVRDKSVILYRLPNL